MERGLVDFYSIGGYLLKLVLKVKIENTKYCVGGLYCFAYEGDFIALLMRSLCILLMLYSVSGYSSEFSLPPLNVLPTLKCGVSSPTGESIQHGC
jgi:hypothetical protein